MVSLLDDLKLVKPRNLPFPEWLISRTPEERTAFEASMADPAISTEALVAIVRKHGGATTPESLKKLRARVSAR